MLINDVFPTIKKNGVNRLEKVSISTQTNKDEVKFFLVIQFDSLEAIKAIAGYNYKLIYLSKNARRVLKRYDQTAKHFELK